MPTPKMPEAAKKTVTINYSDSSRCPVESCQWSDKGIRLHTKWHFPSGAEIELEVEAEGEKHNCAGVVVACERVDGKPGNYMTTLFFVDPPCEGLKSATRLFVVDHGAHSK